MLSRTEASLKRPGPALRLAAALALGGVFVLDSLFVTPYVSERFPRDVDGYDGLVALGDGVEVHHRPDASSPVIATLSNDVVLYDYEADAPGIDGWTPIRLADGELGWVRERLVRSPIDYRAVFWRREGRWRLETFVAGD